ncbi:MAG TPA: STAS domain-containing protein [Candidatus Baltobacteraceae bacterium]|jgi:anti-anti-sigma factor
MELDPTMVVFAGEYDVGSKASLRTLLDRIAEIPDLVLDFREVTFIDSTCVTELLRMHTLRITNSLQRETIILGKTPIRRLFEVLDLYRVFNVVEDVAEVPHEVAALQRVEFTFRNAARQ